MVVPPPPLIPSSVDRATRAQGDALTPSHWRGLTCPPKKLNERWAIVDYYRTAAARCRSEPFFVPDDRHATARRLQISFHIVSQCIATLPKSDQQVLHGRWRDDIQTRQKIAALIRSDGEALLLDRAKRPEQIFLTISRIVSKLSVSRATVSACLRQLMAPEELARWKEYGKFTRRGEMRRLKALWIAEDIAHSDGSDPKRTKLSAEFKALGLSRKSRHTVLRAASKLTGVPVRQLAHRLDTQAARLAADRNRATNALCYWANRRQENPIVVPPRQVQLRKALQVSKESIDVAARNIAPTVRRQLDSGASYGDQLLRGAVVSFVRAQLLSGMSRITPVQELRAYFQRCPSAIRTHLRAGLTGEERSRFSNLSRRQQTRPFNAQPSVFAEATCAGKEPNPLALFRSLLTEIPAPWRVVGDIRTLQHRWPIFDAESVTLPPSRAVVRDLLLPLLPWRGFDVIISEGFSLQHLNLWAEKDPIIGEPFIAARLRRPGALILTWPGPMTAHLQRELTAFATTLAARLLLVPFTSESLEGSRRMTAVLFILAAPEEQQTP